jgi:predicted aspartyl protease
VELKPGHRLPFSFDSGLSKGNIITPEAAKALGLKADQSMVVRDSSGKHTAAELTHVPSVTIGDARLTDQEYAIFAAPTQVTNRPGKPPLAGVLGAPLMKGAVLCVDYAHQKMQRWRNRQGFAATGLVSIPMTTVHDLPTIVVNIDGRPARVIVDTGNNGAIVVFPVFAQKNDFRSRYPALDASGGRSGSGQSFDALSGTADTLEIGTGAVFRDVPLAVIPQAVDPAWGIDGLIGFDVLSALNPCFDRDGQRLLFEGE